MYVYYRKCGKCRKVERREISLFRILVLRDNCLWLDLVYFFLFNNYKFMVLEVVVIIIIVVRLFMYI